MNRPAPERSKTKEVGEAVLKGEVSAVLFCHHGAEIFFLDNLQTRGSIPPRFALIVRGDVNEESLWRQLKNLIAQK